MPVPVPMPMPMPMPMPRSICDRYCNTATVAKAKVTTATPWPVALSATPVSLPSPPVALLSLSSLVLPEVIVTPSPSWGNAWERHRKQKNVVVNTWIPNASCPFFFKKKGRRTKKQIITAQPTAQMYQCTNVHVLKCSNGRNACTYMFKCTCVQNAQMVGISNVHTCV